MAVAQSPDGSNLLLQPLSQSPPVKVFDGKKQTVLIYPENVASDQDMIKFTLRALNKGGIISSANFAQEVIGKKIGSTVVGTEPVVFLPIQSGIRDQNSVEWSPGTLNEVERLFVEKSLDIMNTNNDLGTLTQQTIDDIYKHAKEGAAKDAIKVYLAQLATGTQGLLPRVKGQVLNPNLELLFRGPALRSFSFEFKLSPRTKKEADTVRTIINYFKKNMAARKSGNLFLTAPYVFEIAYLGNMNGEYGRHKSIGRIKRECALKNFNVDYTPLGSYMTYDDDAKTMVSYGLQMEFQELEPLYDTDYQNDPLDKEKEILFADQIAY